MPKTFKHGKGLLAEEAPEDIANETEMLPSETTPDLGEVEERVEEREMTEVREASEMFQPPVDLTCILCHF